MVERATPPLGITDSVDPNRDLGFGAVVARDSRERLLNRDGTFNVGRRGLSIISSISPYHSLLTMSWRRFLSLLTVLYVLVNALFAVAFMLCGPDSLGGTDSAVFGGEFWRAFFFSVETFSTIGYGNITPMGAAANVLVTLESLIGLLAVALATGMIFARFSRPTARILFSEQAVIAPYRGITAFEFRLTNTRKNQIIELNAKVLFTHFEEEDGKKIRRFYPLKLERDKVTFFPLSWTVVHPLDESSPLYGVTHEEMIEQGAEFLVLLTGIDETFSQTVHTRSSYKADEIVWNARFTDIYNRDPKRDILTIDVRKLHHVETVEAVASSQ